MNQLRVPAGERIEFVSGPRIEPPSVSLFRRLIRPIKLALGSVVNAIGRIGVVSRTRSWLFEERVVRSQSGRIEFIAGPPRMRPIVRAWSAFSSAFFYQIVPAIVCTVVVVPVLLIWFAKRVLIAAVVVAIAGVGFVVFGAAFGSVASTPVAALTLGDMFGLVALLIAAYGFLGGLGEIVSGSGRR